MGAKQPRPAPPEGSRRDPPPPPPPKKTDAPQTYTARLEEAIEDLESRLVAKDAEIVRLKTELGQTQMLLWNANENVDNAENNLAHAVGENKRLLAVVEKLPVYADTKEPFIPGYHNCFWLSTSGDVNLTHHIRSIEGQWVAFVNCELQAVSKYGYPTIAAAQSAAKGEK